ERFWDPARQAKVALAARKPDLSDIPLQSWVALEPLLEAVHGSYPPDYPFDGDDLYYDVKSDPHINETFFSELIQHLTTRNEREAKPRTMRMRALIAPHVPGYMALARLQPIDVRYPGGPAMYDAIKMETEYNNNVSLRYGDLLRVAAEQLLIARELELHPELR
ncbi:hypothetical protein IWQ56_005239, partial [Coemansia nantahalensis]